MAIEKERFVCEYLERIDYHGSGLPCLTTLTELQRQHLFQVPFENLELLSDSFVPNLSIEYLYEKIVKRRRGGVCYELNTAFFYLLRAMGFDADQISGRCHVNEPMTGHVFNLVRLREGECIADVGYGDDAVPPLILGGEAVDAYHTRAWIEPDGDGLYRLYLQRPGQEPVPQYQFGLTPRTQTDYMDTFRYSAAPGNTFFSEKPFCCRFTPEGKILLLRGVLTIEENSQITQRRTIADGEETRLCLREYFDLP
jgi:N-hydroxyarylamine O-acetyltransferase